MSAAAASGRRTSKRLPFPGPALEALTLPPWSSTMPRTSDRPMPRPADGCSVGAHWENGSKIFRASSGG